MHEEIILWLECKKYCTPIENIREILMEIQEDMCLRGFSRENIQRAAEIFLAEVSSKLN